MTTKIELRYKKTFKYSKNILATENQYLFVPNLSKNFRISFELAIICEMNLDNFVLQILLDNNLDILKILPI